MQTNAIDTAQRVRELIAQSTSERREIAALDALHAAHVLGKLALSDLQSAVALVGPLFNASPAPLLQICEHLLQEGLMGHRLMADPELLDALWQRSRPIVAERWWGVSDERVLDALSAEELRSMGPPEARELSKLFEDPSSVSAPSERALELKAAVELFCAQSGLTWSRCLG